MSNTVELRPIIMSWLSLQKYLHVTSSIDWINFGRQIQPWATIFIAAVAFFNFISIRRFQKDNNRPVVSAFIQTKTKMNSHNEIELVLKNSGSKPAADITLVSKRKDILKCVFDHVQEGENKYLDFLLNILSGKSKSPLLINGDEDTIEFYYSTDKWAINERSIWKQGSSFPLKISYKDLNNRKYHSKLTITIE